MADCCYQRSCPAPVSTVNVTNVTVALSAGDPGVFKQELLTISAYAVTWQGASYTHRAVLAAIPYNNECLTLYINGILQRSGTDYVRDGQHLYFNFPADARPADMVVAAVYYGTGYTVTPVAGVGMIQTWSMASGTVPAGWLVCDGSAISRVTYAALFDVIGTTYGSGDGSTTFNLPNVSDVLRHNVTTVDQTGLAIIKY